MDLKKREVWFVTGSQHLYGDETLKTVAEHSKVIANALSQSEKIPVQVTFKPVVKTPDEIYKICQAANTDANCIGIITWMHTFSPAKMWIRGLKPCKNRCVICIRNSTVTFRGVILIWIL